VIPAGKGIADALETYLGPSGVGAEWNNRCGSFLQMMGGTVAKGVLTNRTDVVNTLKPQIEGFACFYLWNRLRQQAKLNSALLKTASEHIEGAAQEVTEIFVDALINCLSKPSSSVAAATDPAPTPKGSVSRYCTPFITSTELMEKGESTLEGLDKESESLKKAARKWWNDL
jgi:hypothetical protein